MAITEKVVIEGDSRDAQQAVKGLERTMTRSFLKAEIATRALFKATSVLTTQLQQGFKEAVERDRTLTLRASALRVTGQLTAQNTRLLELQAGALERVTGTSDEVQRSLQAQAISMGVAVGEVDNFIRAAFALQNATGGRMSANSALQNLIKSTSGLKGELGEALPFVRDLTEEQLRSGEAVRLVNQRLGDLVGAGTEGGAGALVRAKNEFANFREELSASIVQSNEFRVAVESISDEFEALGAALRAGAGPLEIFFGATDEGLRTILEAERRIAALDAKAAEIDRRIAERERAARTIDFAGAGGAGALTVGSEAEVVFGSDFLGEAEARVASDASTRLELEQRIADGMQEIRQNNFDRLVLITNDEITLREQAAAEKVRIEDQAAKQMMQLAQQGARIAASFITQGVEALLEGGPAAFQDFAKSFLKNTGTQLIAQGVQNLLTAAAYTFTPGFQPLAAGLASVGTVQLSTGLAFSAGSLVVPGGVGGGRGASSVASADPARTSFGTGRARTEQGQVVNISFAGRPFVTEAEVGLAVRRAVDASTINFTGDT